MYIFNHQKGLFIFLCHKATLSHRIGKERNTAENNFYKDIRYM